MRFVCPDGEDQYRRLIDPEQLAELRAEGHSLEWLDGVPSQLSEWVERVQGADGLLLLWKLPPAVLEASPTVRVVAFAGTGAASYVDMEEARRCGVVVCNVPAYAANAVAEHAFALVLAVARSVPAQDRAVRSGRWGQDAEGLELRGRRLGVVGAGPIGARMIELGRAFGMEIVAWTRSPSPERERSLGARLVGLGELFRTSDVVSLHVAHCPETEGLVDLKLLQLLQPHAILVNTARGALVDQEALVSLLAAGAFRGAGLDVFHPEPPPPDDPVIGSERVVLTPHVGFHTREASTALVRSCLDNLLAFARGRPQNVCP